ncbi:protein D3-like [Stegodyphus dumicola]|uniref:protein D3-like n=1 Tax=Stegodyphus dumicola TaxID=202533 RepID=UPI0015AE77CF|nr:protein D3-like [Stegodyphus dumicola]
MMYILIIKCLFGFIFVTGAFGDRRCKENFKKMSIIPSFAKDIESTDLQVLYGKNEWVKCGEKIALKHVSAKPVVTFDVKGECPYVTLLLFDPDSWLNPTFIHWLVHNIPAETMAKGFYGEDGTVAADYFVPIIPNHDHRYTFFLYCQRKPIKVKKEMTPIQRLSFNTKKFARRKKLGNPVAANFFALTTSGIELPDKSEDNSKSSGGFGLFSFIPTKRK